MFYSNLQYSNGVIRSKVKKHPLAFEEFTQACNPPLINQDYDQNDDEGNGFNFDLYAQSLLIDPSSEISSPFNIGIVRPDSRLIHYIIFFSQEKSTLTPSKNLKLLPFDF